MKSINKNTKLNERFRSNETIEKASLEETTFNYLYKDEINYFFMNPKSFEQIEIKKDIIGEKGKLLTENLEVSVNFYNDSAISVNLPNQVHCKIESTDVVSIHTKLGPEPHPVITFLTPLVTVVTLCSMNEGIIRISPLLSLIDTSSTPSLS